jgi:Trp operon repressor
MAKTKDKVLGAADTAKPYVDLALHDDQLRDNVKTAFAAAREIYDELAGRRGVTGLAQKVATDREIQDNLRTAVEELRRAANRLQTKAADEHRSRNTGLLLTGIALGLLFNPVTGAQTRQWLKHKLVGGGNDDFGYSAPSGNGST